MCFPTWEKNKAREICQLWSFCCTIKGSIKGIVMSTRSVVL